MYRRPYGGYDNKKKYSISKIILIAIILLAVLMTLLAYITLQKNLTFTPNGVNLNIANNKEESIISDIPLETVENPNAIPNTNIENPNSIPNSNITDNSNTSINDKPLYLKNLSDVNTAIDKYNKKEITSVILDLKQSDGKLTYKTNIEYMKNSEVSNINIESTLKTLQSLNIPVVARINAYYDPIATKVFPDAAVKLNSGVIWLNSNNKAHLNPYHISANNYLKDLINEAKNMGFSEVMLYNFGFPSKGKVSLIDYSNLSDSKSNILKKNLDDITNFASALTIKVSLEVSDTLTDGKNTNSGFDLSALQNAKIYYDPAINNIPSGVVIVQ